MQQIKIILIIILFSLATIMSVYGVVDMPVYTTVCHINRIILTQYTPDPTPGITPLPTGYTDVTIIDAITKEPVASARVEIIMVENISRIGWTNSRGKFYSSHPEYKVWYVEISMDGYDTLIIEGVAVGIFELFPIIPDPDNYYEISGTVRDADTGEPIEEATVTLGGYHNEVWERETTTTDSLGRYTIIANIGASAQLWIERTGYTPYATEVSPGIQTHDITMGTIPPGTGDVWIYPATMAVHLNEGFTVEIHANTGNQKFSAYHFNVIYDTGLISLNMSAGISTIEAGADGFFSAPSGGQLPGELYILGFDASGTGPGEDLHIATIHLVSRAPGTDYIGLVVNSLTDPNTAKIGTPNGTGGTVIISELSLGDVDNNGSVTIVDALLVARYYVSNNPSVLDLSVADVNHDGMVDIVDALLIAQFYVGLISYFH